MMSSTMLSALLLALSFSSGVVAQDCTAQLSGIEYTFCGRFNFANIFWTPNLDDGETEFLFEVTDDGYAAFGFSPSRLAAGSMNSANVLWSCDDFVLEDVIAASGLEDLLESPWDAMLPAEGVDRNVASVSAGFLANNLAIDGTISLNRSQGICAVGFTRLNVLDGVLDQDLIEEAPNGVVVAQGDALVPGQHLIRDFALQDFLLNDGDITDVPVELIDLVLPCVSTVGGIQYDNCAVFGPLNVFWNDFDLIDLTIDMLFESLDDGWKAFGFSSQRGASAMINSNVVFGCADFVDQTPEGADYQLTARAGAGVLPMGLQQLSAYRQTQIDGVCAVEFTRPLAPIGVDLDGMDELQALNDGDDPIIRAIFAQGGLEFGAHSTVDRGLMDLDFALPLEQVIPLLEGEVDPIVDDGDDDDIDSAHALSGKVVIFATASLALTKFF